MKKSKRIKPVAGLAHERKLEAARLLAESQRVMLEKQQRLDELEGYRKEYHDKFLQMSLGGSSASTLQRYHHFMGKLDSIIAQQRLIVEAAKRSLEERRIQLSMKESRARILDKVVDNYVRQELAESERLEQIAMDELAARTKPDKE